MLYRFDLEAHRKQLQEYLLDSLPTTNCLIGWLLGTGFFESDAPGKCVIWTTQPDPFQCSDPVVWIFDSVHRMRIFVSTEIILDYGEMTPEALQLVHFAAGYDTMDTFPKFFTDPQLEELYIKSKELLNTIIIYYKENRKVKAKGEDYDLVHGMNCLWSPVFHENFKIVFHAPCFKFIKALSSFDKVLETKLPSGLKLDVLQKSDVAQVQQANEIGYPLDYVEDCFRISSAIRMIDTNELAAWSMTHRDFYTGSLHVMPEHRRKGLAEVILQDLCRKHFNHFRRVLPNNTREMYATATVETSNTPSESLFRKTGWKEFGAGVCWIAYK